MVPKCPLNRVSTVCMFKVLLFSLYQSVFCLFQLMNFHVITIICKPIGMGQCSPNWFSYYTTRLVLNCECDEKVQTLDCTTEAELSIE